MTKYRDWGGAYKEMPEVNTGSSLDGPPRWIKWLVRAILVWVGILFLGAGMFFIVLFLACLSTDPAAYRQQFTDECHARGWNVAYQSDGRMLCQEPGVIGGISR